MRGYKLAKKEAKGVVQNARAKVYNEVYEKKLDTKEVEKDIYIYNYSNKRERLETYVL